VQIESDIDVLNLLIALAVLTLVLVILWFVSAWRMLRGVRMVEDRMIHFLRQLSDTATDLNE
jgi:hypothetical protein